jgi:hypothetical protein
VKRAAFAVLLAACLVSSAAARTLDALGPDGWYTWRVEAADGVPAWCCFSWDNGSVTSRVCNLDRHSGYGGCGDAELNGFVQVYARLDDGQPVELRTLAPGCPVESETEISDLGDVDSQASFDWLRRLVNPGSRVGEDALAAIAMHRGDAPRRFLLESARNAADGDLREAALFWLAQTGARESETTIMRAIASDPESDVREGAVFALSQLPQDRAVDALTAVLRDRSLDRELREEALFWLAQSESDRALAVVEQLLVGGNPGPH